MQFLIGSVLAVSVVASADAADKLDAVYSRWERSQRGLRSLVVEFTREIKDRVFNSTEKADGVFRLVRTPAGETYASFEFNLEKPQGPQAATGRLNNRMVYRLDYKQSVVSVLDYNQKTEFRLKLAEENPLVFLEDYFNPVTVFLDRKRLEAKYNLEIKQDEFYTYMSAKPKHAKQRSGWFGPMDFVQSRVVLMNKASKSIPKDMPRQVWLNPGSQEIIFHIKTWRVNAADGPRVEEFTESEDRPGWRVDAGEWPFKRPGALKK